MDRTRNLDAKLFARDPERPAMSPLPILHDDIREGGHPVARMIEGIISREGLLSRGGEIVIRAQGPDAAKAAEVLRDLFDGPIPPTGEAWSATLEWGKRTREARRNKGCAKTGGGRWPS